MKKIFFNFFNVINWCYNAKEEVWVETIGWQGLFYVRASYLPT